MSIDILGASQHSKGSNGAIFQGFLALSPWIAVDSALAFIDKLRELAVFAGQLPDLLLKLIYLTQKGSALRQYASNAQWPIPFVLGFVTSIAQRSPVLWVKRQLWMRRFGLDVVRVEILGATAIHALAIPGFHHVGP